MYTVAKTTPQRNHVHFETTALFSRNRTPFSNNLIWFQRFSNSLDGGLSSVTIASFSGVFSVASRIPCPTFSNQGPENKVNRRALKIARPRCRRTTLKLSHKTVE